jgi:ABC-2 type transport system ATP-binding protein
MIRTVELTKRYGEIMAVNRLNIEVKPGELFGFLGPNGAGKTTTINMLTGLIRPTSGTAYICGYDITSQIRQVKAITGLMPDTPSLYENLTGRQFVRFIAQLYGVELKEADMKMEELFEIFELTDRADELIKGYSHGMRKKLILVSLIVQDPQVFFLDEPTSGLDPKSARIAKEMLQKLCRQGRTVFMTTHVLEIAERMCDRIAIIDKGNLVAVGTLDELRGIAQERNLEDIFLKLTD